jgi:hypothetical protein
VLNVGDFTCFMNAFAAGDLYANCDGSALPPQLNVNDFVCFINAYGAAAPESADPLNRAVRFQSHKSGDKYEPPGHRLAVISPAVLALTAGLACAETSPPLIRLAYAAFDPASGTPAIPESLRASTSNQLFLVQYSAAPTDSNRADLTARALPSSGS